MNELIQELAKQSIANVRFWNAEKESYEVDRIELEKFAELIVQECANVLHDNELWSRDVSHVLKEHFGVEL